MSFKLTPLTINKTVYIDDFLNLTSNIVILFSQQDMQTNDRCTKMTQFFSCTSNYRKCYFLCIRNSISVNLLLCKIKRRFLHADKGSAPVSASDAGSVPNIANFLIFANVINTYKYSGGNRTDKLCWEQSTIIHNIWLPQKLFLSFENTVLSFVCDNTTRCLSYFARTEAS